ncbi:mannitol dehydrogenase family protein [Sphingomonas piscis]|uniref:Mannitol dehydrogenase family protein n=1 Tax=Sphingomonas piscis TaxID=2714943 RepID=A0A6G7YPY9_9SPHN|nr:mannitol dehydrogenase family protein [Sphingomonas piscis]QIK78804.1 mannitol dehydrogenase family protein [Sphingomonas piscis]
MTPPAYRARLTTGIVHFGPGAFHRAHQAHYVDRLLEHDPRWGIAAVSLRSAGTVEGLRRQDGLYTLAVLDAETSYRTIGAHNRFLGPGEGAAVRQLLGDPAIRIVSSTVTEKGYCLAGDGTLDRSHPDIVHDLATPDDPVSIVSWIALGLGDRRRAGTPAFSTLCCDNMVANGSKLGRAVEDFAREIDPDLARWIEGEARFPNTMVDSITPATDDRLRAMVREASGSDDAIPVAREAFTQWVIEDSLQQGAEQLRGAGVTFAGDVAAWEKAKLRILNGAHSTLAYVGSLIGHATVYDAMCDAPLASFVERLINDDIIPGLQPSPIDLRAYAGEILQRFRNPAIEHKLSQIAWDGSQKLPYRLLDTTAAALNSGRSVKGLAIPVAAWMHFIRRRADEGQEIVDPLRDLLVAAARSEDPVTAFLSLRQIFPARLTDDALYAVEVRSAWNAIGQRGPEAAIALAQA